MNLLSVQDFKECSFDQKCDVVTMYSTYISHRDLPQGKGYLYHTGNFFIEVLYSSAYKKILMIHGFNETSFIEPYADMISLADLNC